MVGLGPNILPEVRNLKQREHVTVKRHRTLVGSGLLGLGSGIGLGLGLGIGLGLGLRLRLGPRGESYKLGLGPCERSSIAFKGHHTPTQVSKPVLYAGLLGLGLGIGLGLG